MKKYVLLGMATMIVTVVQPAIATTANLDQNDPLFQMLQNFAVPFSMIVSLVISLNIFFSGQLSFITLSSDQRKDWKALGLASVCSIAACSLPSLVLGQLGLANVILMLINGTLIAYGLVLRKA